MSRKPKDKKDLLIIFVKNAEPGSVKTRLAEDIGDKKALEVYQKLLRLTNEITKDLKCDRQVWYSDFIDENDVWDAGNYEKKLQYGTDLGERMKNAIKGAFKENYSRVVIIGSDCAQLKEKYIEQAFSKLDENEIVIGPSQDGGYYLLGMKAYRLQLFDDKEWSSASVYDETVNQINEEDYSLARLPVLNDIDTYRDLLESGQRLGEYED